MLKNLLTEARNPLSERIDAMSAGELVRLMNAEDACVAGAVLREAEQIAQAIEIIAGRLKTGGRLIYVGAGTSGRLGVLDAAECPPTFNSPAGQVQGLIAGGQAALTRAVEGAEDHPEFAVADLDAISLGDGDVVVGIASSGRTPYVLGGMKHARRRRAFTIGFSCTAEPELAAVADLMVTPLVGPEVITGSTRLKAGTATKLTLNMLTTGAMVLLGKTYGNLMVDLRATNNKLLDRTKRIVMMLTALDAEQSEALLVQCDGELKTAVVVHGRGISPAEAREHLSRNSGHLRRALDAGAGQAVPDENGNIGSNAASVGHSVTYEYPRQPGNERTLILGIDGGGSKTAVWLLQLEESGAWTVVGRGVAGPSNPQAIGFAAAFRGLDSAIDAAFADAGLARIAVGAACGALAGVERESDRRQVEEWARERRLASRLKLVHDALPLLAAGTPRGHGVALVAGTGSFAFGQNEQGATARAGGWGYLLGDEGSGYAISLSGLRAATQAADQRGRDTRLLPRFLEKLGLHEPLDLIGAVYQGTIDRPTVASWADLVLEEAAAGDAVALDIVARAARDLADAVASVCRKIGFDLATFPLALGGGLVTQNASYRQSVQNELERMAIHPGPVGVVLEPVSGAAILAQRLLEPAIVP